MFDVDLFVPRARATAWRRTTMFIASALAGALVLPPLAAPTTPLDCITDTFVDASARVALDWPSDDLVGGLSPADFPVEANTARQRVIERAADALVLESFHRRGATLGLAARVRAQRGTHHDRPARDRQPRGRLLPDARRRQRDRVRPDAREPPARPGDAGRRPPHLRIARRLCARETILRCSLDRGIYVLHYDLDPTGMWDEGSAGEANNRGLFRGYHIED